MRKIIVGVVVAMFILTTLYYQPTRAADWYVDGTWGTNDGTHGAGSGTSAFKTIQYAVNDPRAANGDTIRVATGIYVEQISIGKSLTLIGAGQNVTTIKSPIPMAPDVDGKRNIVEVRGPYTLTLSRVTVAGGPNPKIGNVCGIDVGIAAMGGAILDITDVTFTNIHSDPFGSTNCGEGIRIGTPRGRPAQEGHATIKNVTVMDYEKNGIVVAGPNSTATIEDNTVTGVVLNTANAQNGIQVNGAVATVVNNIVSNNECGPRFNCGPNPMPPPNDPAKYQSDGILLYQAGAGTTVVGNTIFNNDVGIYNISTGRTTISANILNENRYEGIYLDQGDAMVTDNKVTGGNIGVVVVAWDLNTGNSQGTLTGNTITEAQRGVQVLDENQGDSEIPLLVAFCNNIVNNAVYGMDNTTLNIVSAENNWWGSTSGPFHSTNPVGTGNPVTDNVDFEPWSPSAGTITLIANPESIIADGTSQSIVTATVADMCGRPVPDGTSVSWSTTGGIINLTTSATTASMATTKLTSSTIQETATVTASVTIAGEIISGTANVTFLKSYEASNEKRYMFLYSLRPLAENQIGYANEIKVEEENLFKLAQERGLDTTQCRTFYLKGVECLEKAKKFLQGNNFAAANTYAIYAENELRKARDCLKMLLTKIP